MIDNYDEYLKQLNKELNRKNYKRLTKGEISAFIIKNKLDKAFGITDDDIKKDAEALINQHNQTQQNNDPITTSQAKISTDSLISQQRASILQNQSIHLSANEYFGLFGNVYTTEEKPLGEGGEGKIFRVIGDDSRVIKIYHSHILSKELEQKLRYMADNPPVESILDQVAWPLDILYNSSNQFQGFVMPALDINAELVDIYKYPPTIPDDHKIIIALNICSVINAIHEAGYIFGDFNPNNIGVNSNTGRVAFLDTDSYHIVLDEKANNAYRCKAGFDGYIAPELIKHCEPYKKDAYAIAPLPTFTQETDRFALAVHIFRLLMNGFHPFNGFKETDTLSTPVPRGNNQAIKQDNYCFKPGNKPMAAAVPDLSVLPVELADLFTDAFINGRMHPEKRPTARQWYSALLNYEKELQQCKDNPLHFYKKNLKKCPWCEADRKYNETINQGLIYKQRTYTTPVAAPPQPVPMGGGYNAPPATAKPGGTSVTSSAQTVKKNAGKPITQTLFTASKVLFVFYTVFMYFLIFFKRDYLYNKMNLLIASLVYLIIIGAWAFSVGYNNYEKTPVIIASIFFYTSFCYAIGAVIIENYYFRNQVNGWFEAEMLDWLGVTEFFVIKYLGLSILTCLVFVVGFHIIGKHVKHKLRP